MNSDETKALEQLDQGIRPVDLREVTTIHSKRILRNVKALSSYIAKKEKIDEKKLWGNFEDWVKDNRTKCGGYVTTHLCEYIQEKEGCRSIRNLVGRKVLAFERWDIPLNSNLLERIDKYKRKWEGDVAENKEDNKKKKSDQYQELKDHWDDMIKYTMETDVATLRDHMNSVIRQENNVPTCSKNQLKRMINLSDSDIRVNILKLRAFLLVGKATGLRWISFQRMKVSDWTFNNGGFVIKYLKKKQGNKKRVKSTTEYVYVVPHKDPNFCPVIAFSQFVSKTPEVECPFNFGYTIDESNDTNHGARLRTMALMELVACSTGMDGVGFKKLHAMRAYCTNTLAGKGVKRADRWDHLGWALGSNVEGDHYLDKSVAAANSTTPYVVADREKDVPTDIPAFWDMLETVPLQTDIFTKIAYLAVCAGIKPIAYDLLVNVDFAFSVRAHMERSLAAVLKTYDELLQENQALLDKLKSSEGQVQTYKGRMSKYGLTIDVSGTSTEDTPTVQLTKIVEELKENAKNDNFPAMCVNAFDEKIKSIIDEHGKNDGFLLAQNTGCGKTLILILVIVAAAKKNMIMLRDVRPKGQSWLAFCRTSKNDIPLFKSVDTKKWTTYKNNL